MTQTDEKTKKFSNVHSHLYPTQK